MTYSYSQLIYDLQTGNINRLILIPNRRETRVIFNDGTSKIVAVFPKDQKLIRTAEKNSIPITVDYLKSEYQSASILFNLGIIFIFVVGISFMFRIASKSINNTFKFLDKGNKIVPEDQLNTSFDDIAGITGNIGELKEVVQFIHNSEKLEKLGGKTPKGIILSGPPGTGKTLLAKAIAGEAKVPFFNVSGSEFVELFIGIGATRVRSLFEKAIKSSPCIIFIDEIDAIGSSRGGGVGMGNDEREQTLNQLLTEMDGYKENTGLIVLAATNRLEILDKSLTRPGRFDRIINLEIPDRKSREEILNIHALSYPLDKNVCFKEISSKTSGFTGAGLKNLLNESAIDAARNNKKTINMKNIDRGFEKISLGPRYKFVNHKQKVLLAYREVAKALIAFYISYPEKIHKISICPSIYKTGNTIFLPDNNIENQIYTKHTLISKLKIFLAPRAAEILIFGETEITGLSSQELDRVWKISKDIVEKYGFNKKQAFYIEDSNSQNLYSNILYREKSKYSQSTKKLIDHEIISLTKQCLKDDLTILRNKISLLKKITYYLVDSETIHGDNFYNLIGTYK
tara:strand:+ start:150 stop:1859 length:1710 start_codon:yes stop_codon:yes gene_type:complete